MKFQQQYTFFIEAIFMVAATGMYVHPLNKPETAKLRALFLFLADFIIIPLLVVVLPAHFLHFMLQQFVAILLLSATVYKVVQGHKSGAVYVAIWGSMTAHFIYSLWHVIKMLAFDDMQQDFSFAMAMFLVVFYLLFYYLLSQTLAKTMPDKGKYRIGPRQMISTVGFYVVFLLLYYLVVYQESEEQIVLYYISLLVAETYCLTMLYVQTELFKKSALEKELLTMNLLWQQEKEQYEIARENIELINHKCHDLKHQIHVLQRMDKDDESKEKYLSQLEKSVQIYDSIVKTGNDVLDTILTDKSLRCEDKGIKINCVVDGSRMDFIDPVDLYSILGNAVDNAMEEVEKFQQKEKRLLDISIFAKGKFLMMVISNPMETEVTFHKGLPQTTKGNNGYHGYGLRSIKRCVEQYHGQISIDAGEGRFTLKIMMPIPATT